MDNIIGRRNELKKQMEALHDKKKSVLERLELLIRKIDEKKQKYEQLKKSSVAKKSKYRSKLKQAKHLRSLVEKYKAQEFQKLSEYYYGKYNDIIDKINGFQFKNKLEDIKSFKDVMEVYTGEFPSLEKHKRKFIKRQQDNFLEFLGKEIDSRIGDFSKVNELIYYLNIVIQYETEMKVNIFLEILYELLELKFKYHFQSNRDSNRLDKPEWLFKYILSTLSSFKQIYDIYTDCLHRKVKTKQKNSSEKKYLPDTISNSSVSENLFRNENVDFSILIVKTLNFVKIKIDEIKNTKSSQKKSLCIHFSDEFLKYHSDIKKTYSVDLDTSMVGNFLQHTYSKYVRKELIRINKMNYVQWFLEYRRLTREIMQHISKYSNVDKETRLTYFIDGIILHINSFLENLYFIDRKEINIICFVFNQIEDLKTYIEEEELEIKISSADPLEFSVTSDSIESLSNFNSQVLKTIKKLAVNDTSRVSKKLEYYEYLDSNAKRSILVDLYKIVEEYKQCLPLIERTVIETIDDIFMKNIILAKKFESDKYLEFRSYYNSVKNIFTIKQWRSDDGIKAIDCIFEGKRMYGDMFEKIKKLYK